MVSKTKEELNQDWIKHAKEVIYKLEKEVHDRERQEKREHYNAVVKPEEQLQKAKDARDPYEGDGKRTYWELVNHEAHKLINDNFQGYNDWAIAMSGLVHIAMLLAKAMWYDSPELSNLIPHSKTIGDGFTGAGQMIWDWTADTYHRYGDLGSVDKDKLPGVGFTASLDAQGKLVAEATINGKPDPDPQEHLTFALRAGTVAWAKSQGYDFDTTTQTFKDADGNQMTNEKFKELNNGSNLELGLKNFMTGGFMPVDLNLGPRP